MIRRTVLYLLAVTLLLLTACVDPNQYDGLQVASGTVPAPVAAEQRPRLGIAFGGGGVRGFMHLGVIRALEENHIKADVVTGSSAGSIAAVLYASGLTSAEIEKAVSDLTELQLADLVLSRQGVINGKKLAAWIDGIVPQKDLSAMPIPVGVTATDMTNRRARLIVAGDPGQAVQASSSIPGAFVPVTSQGKLLVDGGILDVIPIRSARSLGAQVVVGVDIYCHNQPEAEASVGKMLLGTVRMLSCRLAEEQIAEADLMIAPDFEPENMGSFAAREEEIAEGYRAAMAVMPQLKALVEARVEGD